MFCFLHVAPPHKGLHLNITQKCLPSPTKSYAAVLESNLNTARKSDPNAGDPGDANDSLKEGETRLEMVENGSGRFVKWTTGPVLFPAEYFADKMNTDVESLLAAPGPRSPEVNTGDKNSEESEWEIV
ncbi:hypothetical protein FDENT_13120 [Fusarium denticulatum]|uniref:Uncharacterized protein n=1 Tax=Fusarium denticulatum TaxID=48507 RepID=A0A8H5T0N3_9HYPO|nr:hypothetical protein FDENT_13120 [Fusarium denticulatum]